MTGFWEREAAFRIIFVGFHHILHAAMGRNFHFDPCLAGVRIYFQRERKWPRYVKDALSQADRVLKLRLKPKPNNEFPDPRRSQIRHGEIWEGFDGDCGHLVKF